MVISHDCGLGGSPCFEGGESDLLGGPCAALVKCHNTREKEQWFVINNYHVTLQGDREREPWGDKMIPHQAPNFSFHQECSSDQTCIKVEKKKLGGQ